MSSTPCPAEHLRVQAGFSLLEVIIATALLAASSMLLLQLLSVGERHGEKGEERVIAQMLCQSLLEELAAGVRPLQAWEEEPLPGYPGWVASVDWIPTDLEGLVQVHVRISQVPLVPDRESPRPSRETTGEPQPTVELGPHRATFEITRWMRSTAAPDDKQDTSEASLSRTVERPKSSRLSRNTDTTAPRRLRPSSGGVAP